MSLFRRHIGRRVAGVGVGVALLMLGLEAPALADPVISGISPTSGPEACVVVISGTGFDQPGAFAVSDVRFTGAGNVLDSVDALFHVVSDTEIWTTVPTGAATGPITITDGNGTTANSPTFTVTTTAGTCAPTITSFDPVCGVVGTVVTITGTNLLKSGGDDSTTPVTKPAGGDVKFNPYTANATHTGAAESPTTLVVNVPASAVDGPIRVKTFAAPDSTVTSTGSFNVAASPTECGGVSFARSITLRLKDALVARGKVTAATVTPPAPAECTAAVPVKIQRRVSGHWKTVGKTTTSDTGAYRKKIRNRHGKYRSLAPSVTLASGDVCSRAKSKVVRH
jgi:IPT/TIG domain